jgi:hypothetical protein
MEQQPPFQMLAAMHSFSRTLPAARAALLLLCLVSPFVANVGEETDHEGWRQCFRLAPQLKPSLWDTRWALAKAYYQQAH